MELDSGLFYLKHLNLEMLPEFDVDEYLLIRREKEEKLKKKNRMTVRMVKSPFKMDGSAALSGRYDWNHSEDNAAKHYENRS